MNLKELKNNEFYAYYKVHGCIKTIGDCQICIEANRRMSNHETENFHEGLLEGIMEDEGFINDLWNRYGVSDKLSTLQKSGWTMEMIIKEYIKMKEIQDEPMDEDDDSANPESEGERPEFSEAGGEL